MKNPIVKTCFVKPSNYRNNKKTENKLKPEAWKTSIRKHYWKVLSKCSICWQRRSKAVNTWPFNVALLFVFYCYRLWIPHCSWEITAECFITKIRCQWTTFQTRVAVSDSYFTVLNSKFQPGYWYRKKPRGLVMKKIYCDKEKKNILKILSFSFPFPPDVTSKSLCVFVFGERVGGQKCLHWKQIESNGNNFTPIRFDKYI